MRLASILLFLSPLALAPSLAQNAAAPAAAAAPTLKVYSRETIVDVTVTDAKGNPVHGLTQADFTVKEDNKPQAIRSFAEYSATAAPAESIRGLPPTVYTNQQPPETAPALNIVLLDGLNTAPTDGTEPPQVSLSFFIQTRVKQGAEKYVSAMPAGTRVTVLNLATNLRTLQDSTSDRALLKASIDAMGMDMNGHAIPPGLPGAQDAWCTEQNTRNRATLEALNLIASNFSKVKGKKNLFWFSLGFPSVVLQTGNAGTGCLPDYTIDLHKTYAALTAAQVVLYPIGAHTPGLDIPNPGGPGTLSMGTPAYNQATADTMMALEQMAADTGGQAFYNSNDLAGLLGKAIAAGSGYYTLSYAPPGSKYDGRHHAIHVDVNRPGLTLTYRKEYWAEDPSAAIPQASQLPGSQVATPTPDPAAAPDMRVQMTRAMPTSSDLVFDVRVKPADAPATSETPPAPLGMLNAKYKDKPLTRYAFDYSIPGQEIALPKGDGGLEFDLAAYDEDGNVVTSLRQAIKIAYTPDDAAQLLTNSFLYSEQLDLPAGALFLRIGVLDRTSNKLGTLEIPLTVAKK